MMAENDGGEDEEHRYWQLEMIHIQPLLFLTETSRVLRQFLHLIIWSAITTAA